MKPIIAQNSYLVDRELLEISIIEPEEVIKNAVFKTANALLYHMMAGLKNVNCDFCINITCQLSEWEKNKNKDK